MGDFGGLPFGGFGGFGVLGLGWLGFTFGVFGGFGFGCGAFGGFALGGGLTGALGGAFPGAFGGPLPGAFGGALPGAFGGPAPGPLVPGALEAGLPGAPTLGAGCPAPGAFGAGAPGAFGAGAPGAFGLPGAFGFGAPTAFGLGAPGAFGAGAPGAVGFRVRGAGCLGVGAVRIVLLGLVIAGVAAGGPGPLAVGADSAPPDGRTSEKEELLPLVEAGLIVVVLPASVEGLGETTLNTCLSVMDWPLKLVGLKLVWKRVTGGFLKTRVAGLRTWVGAPAMFVGWSTLVTVVSGPPRSLLVKLLKKPCGEVTVVHVEAGWVMIMGVTVLTRLTTVLGTGPGMVCTTFTGPVERLTKVAAGVEVVMVLPPVGPVFVDGGCVMIPPPGAVMIVNVTTMAPGIVVCGFGRIVVIIAGEVLVMIGLPPGLAGTTTTVLAPAGTVIVLGGITVVTPCGPPMIVCVTIVG